MSNVFFDWPAKPTADRFVRFTTVRAADVNAAFDLVSAGFEKLPTPTQIWGANENYAVASGSVNVWTATIAATYLTALTDGMQVRVKIPAANTSTTPTFNLNGLGAKTIVRDSNLPVAVSDITANMVVVLTYNSTYDKWQLTQAIAAGSASDINAAQLAASSGAGLIGNAAAGGISAGTVQGTINALAGVGGAALIGNTAAGNIVATNVQAAINELDTEKAKIGANSDITSLSALASINGGQIAGFRNRILNGTMSIDQRNAGAAQTFTAGAALAYAVDRWYGYCTGANVTGQQVAGTAPNAVNYRFTGAASVTKIGFAQRIEVANSQEFSNTTVTLAVDLANSLLTTVTWTAWYANTANTFGTLASPTRTQIATGTFTVNSTLARYNAQISVPSAATTGIEVEFSVGAQTSGTWTIGGVQLENGAVATPFENRSVGIEYFLCQRYYQQSYSYGGTPGQAVAAGAYRAVAIGTADLYSCGMIFFKTPLFASPAMTLYSSTGSAAGSIRDETAAGNLAVTAAYAKLGTQSTDVGFSSANLTAGRFYSWHWTALAEIP